MKIKTPSLRKVEAAWNRKLWGFYDLQNQFNPPPLITKFAAPPGYDMHWFFGDRTLKVNQK